MNYDRAFFDRGVDRRGTQSTKWELSGVMSEGMIPLWVADMDFPCAEPIREALRARAEHPSYGYTFESAADFDALSGFWQRRHGVRLNPGETLMLPTVVAGLRAAVNTMTQPGDGVIIQTPVYGPFSAAIRDSGRVILDAPLLREAAGRYRMNLDKVESHLKKGARLFILCSPHNPVSRAWEREELLALIQLLRRYGARLVADEIHADFVYSPRRFISVLTLPETPAQTIALVSASKTFNVAGLLQATAICRDADTLRLIFRFIERSGASSGNIFALAGTRAAYNDCDDWLDGVTAYLSENRAILLQGMNALLPDAVVTPMEATYLAWVDIRPYGIPQCDVTPRCAHCGVALTDGQFFGETEGDGFMRVNYGCPRSQLSQGLERFARAINKK